MHLCGSSKGAPKRSGVLHLTIYNMGLVWFGLAELAPRRKREKGKKVKERKGEIDVRLRRKNAAYLLHSTRTARGRCQTGDEDDTLLLQVLHR